MTFVFQGVVTDIRFAHEHVRHNVARGEPLVVRYIRSLLERRTTAGNTANSHQAEPPKR